MKKLFLALLLIIGVHAFAQDSKTTVALDENGNLIGVISRENFLSEPYSDWYASNYENYEANQTTIESLTPLLVLNGITVKVFMGTWCSDSQEQTPVFYKVMDACDFNEELIEVIGVNDTKTTPDNLQEGFDLERVPTFIFYKDGIEIGRIVEYPQETMEADMLKIVSGQPYKHSYEEK
jgi:thiol-disulfide isomerase/thioredoxin